MISIEIFREKMRACPSNKVFLTGANNANATHKKVTISIKIANTSAIESLLEEGEA